MPTNINEKAYQVYSLDGGIQRKSTRFVKKANQVDLAVNADFSRIGGVQKIKGYDRFGNTITTSSSSSTSTTTSTTTTTTTSSSTSTSSTTTSGA
jgi:hypothetical protein